MFAIVNSIQVILPELNAPASTTPQASCARRSVGSMGSLVSGTQGQGGGGGGSCSSFPQLVGFWQLLQLLRTELTLCRARIPHSTGLTRCPGVLLIRIKHARAVVHTVVEGRGEREGRRMWSTVSAGNPETANSITCAPAENSVLVFIQRIGHPGPCRRQAHHGYQH